MGTPIGVKRPVVDEVVRKDETDEELVNLMECLKRKLDGTNMDSWQDMYGSIRILKAVKNPSYPSGKQWIVTHEVEPMAIPQALGLDTHFYQQYHGKFLGEFMEKRFKGQQYRYFPESSDDENRDEECMRLEPLSPERRRLNQLLERCQR